MNPARGSTCPCGNAKNYLECCGHWHQGFSKGTWPSTPEQLMRSRYAAYVLKLEEYLLVTWHPETRPGVIEFEEEAFMKWLGLKILRAENNIVEFVARYKINGKAEKLHEVSRFEQLDGNWYYLDGVLS